MADVDLGSFIKELEDIKSKNSLQKFEKDILQIYEPIVLQIVLRTRADTGHARASVGFGFANDMGSSKIKEAYMYDVQVNDNFYRYWDNFYPENIKRFPDGSDGDYSKNSSRESVEITISSDDIGFVNQENGEFPSPYHPRPDNTAKRFPPENVGKLFRVLNAIADDLE